MMLFGMFLTAAGLVAAAAAPAAPGAASAHGSWPLDPHAVVREFEPPSSEWTAGHRGVDLAGTVGESVRTAMAGEVTFAGMIAGRGVVVVNHGETRTTYEPVVAAVNVGQRVAEGEQIGSLEVVQSHCFPSACLHWGWRRGEEYLDPRALVAEPPRIRLLPLEN